VPDELAQHAQMMLERWCREVHGTVETHQTRTGRPARAERHGVVVQVEGYPHLTFSAATWTALLAELAQRDVLAAPQTVKRGLLSRRESWTLQLRDAGTLDELRSA